MTLTTNGDVDLIFTRPSVIGSGRFELHGNENANFAQKQEFGLDQGGANDITLGDIDGDGDLDVVSNFRQYFGDQWGGFVSWHENSDGRFVSTHNLQLSSGDHIGKTSLHDIDNDGDLDIMTSRQKWFENDGSGGFSERVFYEQFAIVTDAQFGDIDGDGDLDGLVLRRSNDGSSVVWYENLNGRGSFGEPQTVAQDAEGVRGVALADLDNDGDVDPLLRSENEIHWFQNQDGVFGPKEELVSTVEFIRFLLISDLDGDDDRDLVAVVGDDEGQSNRVAWFENTFSRVVGDVNCDAEFGSADLLEIFIAGEYEDGIPNNSTYDEGDFNGDGDFDSSDFVFALTHGDYKQSKVFSRADLSSALLDKDETTKRRPPTEASLVDDIASQW